MNEYGCDEDCLTDEERRKIISRFHSLFFWVGEVIPELEDLEGNEVPLKDVVFHFITDMSPNEETVNGARKLASLLENKAKALENDLATEDMERDRAYQIMHEALGLLRAVDELHQVTLEDRHVKARALMTKVNDEHRWLKFVNQIKVN